MSSDVRRSTYRPKTISLPFPSRWKRGLAITGLSLIILSSTGYLGYQYRTWLKDQWTRSSAAVCSRIVNPIVNTVTIEKPVPYEVPKLIEVPTPSPPLPKMTVTEHLQGIWQDIRSKATGQSSE